MFQSGGVPSHTKGHNSVGGGGINCHSLLIDVTVYPIIVYAVISTLKLYNVNLHYTSLALSLRARAYFSTDKLCETENHFKSKDGCHRPYCGDENVP